MSHPSTTIEPQTARTLRRLAREASRRARRDVRRERIRAKLSFLTIA